MKFIKSVPPVYCGDNKDWVKVNGSTVFITKEALARHGDIQCAFTGQLKPKDIQYSLIWPLCPKPSLAYSLRFGYTVLGTSY